MISSWFNAYTSFSSSHSSKYDVLSLSTVQRKYYLELVKKLSLLCQARVDHPKMTRSQQNDRCVYAIVCRQSRSWKEVENMLNTLIEVPSTPKAIKNWAVEWKEDISNLRVLQNTLFDHAKNSRTYSSKIIKVNQTYRWIKTKLASLDKEEEALDLQLHIQELTFQLQNLQKKFNVSKEKIISIQKQILNCMNKREDKLKKDSKNYFLKSNELAQKTLDFWNENRSELTVFTQWWEVRMNENLLRFNICQLNPNPDITKLSRIEACLEKDRSTKAVFLIERETIKIPVEFGGDKTLGTMTLSTEISLKTVKHDLPSPKKVTSTQLTREILMDYPLAEGIKTKEKISFASADTQIKKIVYLALQKVNEKIKNDSLSVEEGEGEGEGEGNLDKLMPFLYPRCPAVRG